jgi:hypothetical protein
MLLLLVGYAHPAKRVTLTLLLLRPPPLLPVAHSHNTGTGVDVGVGSPAVSTSGSARDSLSGTPEQSPAKRRRTGMGSALCYIFLERVCRAVIK